jgi:hypothetical protein
MIHPVWEGFVLRSITAAIVALALVGCASKSTEIAPAYVSPLI